MNDSRLVVAMEAPYYSGRDGRVWTDEGSGVEEFSTHLDVFDQVTIAVRTRAVDTLPGTSRLFEHERLSVYQLPWYRGLPGFVLAFPRLLTRVWRLSAQPGSPLLLLPGPIATLLGLVLALRGRPFGVQLVGDIGQVLASPGMGVAARALRTPAVWLTRWLCKSAVSVAYVSGAELTSAYPCGHDAPQFTFSRVRLAEQDFRPAPRPRLPSVTPTVAFCGSLAQLYKGPDVLLEALTLLRRRQVAFKAIILGDGRYRRALERQAEAGGIERDVEFAGFQGRETVRQILDRADLFVLPSRTEGLPRALVEAMAMALPCVGTTVGGIPELLAPEDLVPPGDGHALADAIEDLLRDPVRYEAASARNVARARAFDAGRLDAVARAFLERLRTLAASDTRQREDSSREATSSGQRFAFGRNWSGFLARFDDTRLEASMQRIKAMLDVSSLTGLRALDIGSGSGLSALALNRLGATVHAFDADRESVACTRELLGRYAARGSDWSVEHRSILEPGIADALGRFDLVYAWGVLHHTGDQWLALKHAEALVAEGGRIYVALYNDQGRRSRLWAIVKRTYVQLPAWLRFLVVVPCYAALWGPPLIRDALRLRPLASWRAYTRQRGMSPHHDLIDWVGGYPFEVSTPHDVFEFFRSRGYALEALRTCGGAHGCNEYVFRRGMPAVSLDPGSRA